MPARTRLLHCFLFLPLFFSVNAFPQYILNGTATKINCNCYQLTDSIVRQSGSVWNNQKISLDSSFDFHFNVFLGCLDAAGADGIVFILQTVNTSVGIQGSGLGFEGVSPSVGISLDTWQNIEYNDPPFDHITIQLNGHIQHDGHDLAGPINVSATSDNIEDCSWHTFRITWDASTQTIAAYFDGVFRLQAKYDLVGKVFNNNPKVYWGFSGSTGGEYNVQKFCTSLNSGIVTSPDTATCIGNTLQFTDSSESFTAIRNYYWDFGDGSNSTLANPPVHLYMAPGGYVVKHVITGADGCLDSIGKLMNIGSYPRADFALSDTCTNKLLGVTDKTYSAYGAAAQWTWWLDGNIASTDSLPLIDNLSLGEHQLQLAETSLYGCPSDTVAKNFSVHPTPVVSISGSNGCWKQPIHFRGKQTDNATNLIQWNWNFGNGVLLHQQNTDFSFAKGGLQTVHLTALADDGCTSNDTSIQILAEDIFLHAGNDTSVQWDKPFTLSPIWSGHYIGTPTFTWSPPDGLNSTHVPDPDAILEHDQKYYLTVTTDKGCTATDVVKISAFKNFGALVPTAFTPNGDGLNDILLPRYNGIKQLNRFAIYNRLGQLVFQTSDMKKGWDGTYKNAMANTETFVWIASAVGFDGKIYQSKGTVTLIR